MKQRSPVITRRRRRRGTTNSPGILCAIGLGILVVGVGFIYTAELLLVGDGLEQATVVVQPHAGAARSYPNEVRLTPLREVDRSFYTVRINTWERPEQLVVSVAHHSQCAGAMQVQVVWCDAQSGVPPVELTQNPKVVIERHSVNSLNERFNLQSDTPTMGILSIDDDVLRPCEAIDSGFLIWTQNPHRMVGFDARLHDEEPGQWRYGYLSTTEKANRYSLSLTRYCFLHRDYMDLYMTSMPKPIFNTVEKSFNCEDIAMSFFISSLTDGRPPLLADFWAMQAKLKLYSKSSISGTSDHKQTRDKCVDSFSEQLGLKQESKRLQAALLQHKKHPFFACGTAPDYMIEELRDVEVPRLKALVEKVARWKKSNFDVFRKEVAEMRNGISLQAWKSGLVEKTEPWKIKFGKK